MYLNLLPGDPAPWFVQRSARGGDFALHTAGGGYVVLCFYASAGDPLGRAAVETLEAHATGSGKRVSFFGVSLDPEDERLSRVKENGEELRFIYDFNGSASELYGVVPKGEGASGTRRLWYVIDPGLRIRAVIPLAQDGSDRAALGDVLERLPPLNVRAGVQVQAPVLVLPDVFDQALCRELIGLYEAAGGTPSTVQRDREGVSVNVDDRWAKVRKDYVISNPADKARLNAYLQRRVLPEIEKIHQFRATHIERHLIGCYAAEDGGHFGAHRDNITLGTAHRRFAVSVNLSDDFDGGELGFPEYGETTFKPASGGAVVFSCSLLHRVTPVTAGRRYAFLPFVYDEAGARIRKQNAAFLEGAPPAAHDASPR